MCNRTCIEFAQRVINREDIQGKSVLEVGSLDINGSLRPIVEIYHPYSYIGIDIINGHGVDVICDSNQICAYFGQETFDCIIATELIEHVRDWKDTISNFKNALKSNGIILITTRSKGFHFHGYPYDYWRYEVKDMRAIFSDFHILALETDKLSPGVLLKARKPVEFVEFNTNDYQLYSIIKNKRISKITDFDIGLSKIQQRIKGILLKILPQIFIQVIRKLKF